MPVVVAWQTCIGADYRGRHRPSAVHNYTTDAIVLSSLAPFHVQHRRTEYDDACQILDVSLASAPANSDRAFSSWPYNLRTYGVLRARATHYGDVGLSQRYCVLIAVPGTSHDATSRYDTYINLVDVLP